MNALSTNDWRSALVQATTAEFNAPLAPRVAFRIGGPADAFVKPRTKSELEAVLRISKQFDLPLTLLGTGSNVLVADAGIRGITARLAGALAETRLIEDHGDAADLEVGAGALNAQVVAQAFELGLAGLEFLGTIPGTFGGALIMNAGAHGGEIGPFVRSVAVLGPHGIEDRSGPDCGFGYRTSGFGPNERLLSARLRVPRGDVAAAKSHLQQMRESRKRSQPLDLPNAGSIFKNPPGDFAGRLIERAGLKGQREGGAQISELHANFIVNVDRATAADVARLAARAQDLVRQRFGVALEWEVRRIGAWSEVPT